MFCQFKASRFLWQFENSFEQTEHQHQEIMVYELMKSRKRSETRLSEQANKEEQRPKNRAYSFVKSLNEPDTVSLTNSIKEDRKSIESKRSLSLIYPNSKYKHSNSTIMKLLGTVQTLSALCTTSSRCRWTCSSTTRCTWICARTRSTCPASW